MKEECARFLARNPIGSKVRYWTGAVHVGAGRVGEVVAPGAYVLGGHTSVVQIAGAGCIALSHAAPAEGGERS